MYIINSQYLCWIILLIINRTIGQSINQPVLCPSVTWNPNAITFADESIIGDDPTTVFINLINSVYVAEGNASQVQIWNVGDVTPSITISGDLMNPYGLFISSNGDIYIDNGAVNGRVEKWTLGATSGVTVMNVSGSCYSLFVDMNNTLYCSLNSLNQVVKTSLNNLGNPPTVAAGSGVAGAASNMLNEPHGIFVDSSLNLYIADSGNNRIQLYLSGQLTGTTVAGSGSTLTVILNYPTAVILDANGYLYIADTNNDRIVRTDPSGYRCIVGCTGSSGAAANELSRPWSLSFDSYGDLFVTDQNNTRIQKFILATDSCGPAYNRLYFCATTTWNPDAVTFADSSVVGLNPYGVFVSVNNTVYVTATNLNQVQVWLEGSSTPTSTISASFNSSYAVVTSIIGDIYIDNGAFNNRVDKWAVNAINSTVEMYIDGRCYGLFIDANDGLYCSLGSQHMVVKKLIGDNANNSMIVAGTGVSGSGSNMLNEPRGIFVDLNFNLYVADCLNNRIQRFPSGQLTAVTVAGTGSSASGNISLNCPTGLVLDGNGYLYITDFNNHRIVGSSANGFRCLVGCSGISGSASDQLYNPTSLSFDSYGNLYVADMNNNRIQQFALATNSCGPSYNKPVFCATATWSLNAVTFANSTIAGNQTFSVFVNTNNTVYVADQTNNNIQIWIKGATTPTTAIFNNLNAPFSVFTTITGDIYADNGGSNGQVDVWIANATTTNIAMYVSGICYGLFLDIYDNIYCSLGDFHQVIKKLSSADANTSTTVAGTGVNGSSSVMLNTPQGIFVTTKFNLYVADSGNNRIQLFPPMQLNGTSVAGSGAPNTITLNFPTGITLDSQGYLFIVDSNNNRIIGSSANGFRCIAGCSSVSGSGSDQLNYPKSLSFDSSGNLYVADTYNNRIQKFTLTMNSCGRSYNLPKFCTYPSWNPNGITFADNTTVGSYPSDIFISTTNQIYVAETNLNQVQMWLSGNSTPTITISANLTSPYSVFASIIGDIYIDNGAVNNRVDQWILNGTSSVVGMYSNSTCYDFFVDIYDNLYCSINSLHVVMKRSFNNDPYTLTIAAGTTGTNGSGPYMLNGPRGIFVDTKFNLYVADCGNNRIQLFQLNQLNGTTVLQNATIEAITLSCPTALVLDGSGYLFITDYNNHRIIATGPTGLQCIVGCSGYGGSAANELYYPRSLNFDSYGNLYVTDTGNQRIQKFVLATNSCYGTTTAHNLVTSAMSTEISTMNIQSTHITSISVLTTISVANSFVPSTCSSPAYIGPNCNVFVDTCSTINPCQNDGTCVNVNTTLFGYDCLCLNDVSGTECQYDNRVCQSDTCWNNGTCEETSNTTYLCTCAAGWQNSNCELLVNYCSNVTCLNNGVCKPLLLDYQCECLSGSYSGQYCQITSSRILTLQAVSRSFAFIAIIAIACIAIFIIVMDILTYCFGIDLAHSERLKMRQKNYLKKKKPTVISPRNDSVHASAIHLSQRSTLIVEELI